MPRSPQELWENDPYGWVVEEAFFDLKLQPKAMFGGLAYYHRQKMIWVSIQKTPPFRGLLLPTSHEHHASLMAQFPALAPHPQLGKWLYLPEEAPGFEETALGLAALLGQNDPRLGVLRGAGKKEPAAKNKPVKAGQKKASAGKSPPRRRQS